MASVKTPLRSLSGDPAAGDLTAARRVLAAASEALKVLADTLDGDFTRAVDVMLAAQDHQRPGRVIVSGMGKSGHVARKIAATFSSTGTPAYFVHPAEASHGDMGAITKQDVLLLLSKGGETAELSDLLTYAKRFRIPLIAMTADRDSTLGKAADIVLVQPKAREACPHNLAPTTSSLMQLALGDALAISLLEGRVFTSVDFSVLHPGGKLGALLKYTRDLMHSGDAVPLKPLGTKMSDALVEMTSKGFGCVGIVDGHGQIVGIVTDGDLRRHMRPDLMTALVDDVMTRNPKTIGRDMLASEALEILNSSKITALIVTDGKKPAGIVHLHDLLRAGVA